MHLVVFEGPHWPNFAPLSFSRPVFSMTCGLSSLLEKQIRHLKPTRLTLWIPSGTGRVLRTLRRA